MLLLIYYKWAFLVWAIILSIFSAVLCGFAVSYKVNLPRLLAPRFLLGVIIGWIALVASKDLLALNSNPSGWMLLIPIVLTIFYLFTEVSNRFNDWYKSLGRAISLFGLGFLQSFLIGFLITLVVGPDRLFPPLFNMGTSFETILDENRGINKTIPTKLQESFEKNAITLDSDNAKIWKNKEDKDAWEIVNVLFCPRLQLMNDLDEERLPDELREKFLDNNDIKIRNAPVSVVQKNEMWQVTGKDRHNKMQTYSIEQEKTTNTLVVYQTKYAIRKKHEKLNGYIPKKTSLGIKSYSSVPHLLKIDSYPVFLFSATIYALFTGVILQVLWDDKPVTRPL